MCSVVKSGIMKIEGSRKVVDRGTRPLCPRGQNVMHISLTCMEQDTCREGLTTATGLEENK